MPRQQRKPRQGPYQKVNAYSQRPALQQIVALLTFLIILILHSIFIVPPIVAVIQHPILIFLMSLNYVLLIIIAYDYIYLTVKDPVDSLVCGLESQESVTIDQLKKCILCDQNVYKESYHCMRCNRCTDGFDHHCKYLNNCVGSKNYESFFRILVVLTVYFLVLIAQCIWVFVDSFNSDELEDYMISKWPVLAVGVVVVVLIIGVDSLLGFHIYLTLIRKMTTLEYIFRDTSSNTSGSDTRSVSSSSAQRIDSGDPL